MLAEAQTRAAALEQIVDYGREAAQKETEALVNRGTALLARAEEAAAGTNTWQEHLAAGKRQHDRGKNSRAHPCFVMAEHIEHSKIAEALLVHRGGNRDRLGHKVASFSIYRNRITFVPVRQVLILQIQRKPC